MKAVKDLATAIVDRGLRLRPKSSDRTVPRIFYCHVPKCAGASISRTIRKQVFAGRKRSTFGIDLRASQEAARLFSMEMMEAREVVLAYHLSIARNRFGSGHVYCRPHLVDRFMNEWHFVTLLRNPVDRWISEYVYNTYKDVDWAKNTLEFDAYLASETAQSTATSFLRYFSSIPSGHAGSVEAFVDEAVANLERFSVIGVVENLDQWRDSFETRFGRDLSIPRVNTSPDLGAADEIRSNDSLMKTIRELCEPDLRIYRRILESASIQSSA